MPELPEVETVRRSLLAHLPGLTITGVDVRLPRLIKYPAVSEFTTELKGQTFLDIQRRGKYLKFIMSGGQTLVIHLRMTGQLRYACPDNPLPRHTHVIFNLSDGWELRFTDMRQFGAMYLASHAEIGQVAGMDRLGWEPLEHFPLAEFCQELARRSAKIKSLLLNQHFIAGIGNIYADEGLFAAGIHPEQPAKSLTAEQGERLHTALVQVLRAGVQMRGTSFSDYVDGLGRSGDFQHQLAVYGREGQACPRCGTQIQRIKVSGRSSHFCPCCQSAPEQI
ncbi:MAG: DNA-formamidopyrimidine glycosylase [Firmicutes bacterium]|nr:DNA-formamidopyrimidine glycosylase [Bacillota bacterium]